MWDPLDDTIALMLANIPKLDDLVLWAKFSQTSIFTSRILRYQDYDTISSPWWGNKEIISALAGRPYTWNPGYIDNEADSIAVSHLLMPITLNYFQTGYLCDPTYTQAVWDSVRDSVLRNGLRDSVQSLPYRPGFDYVHPFGQAAAYTLDSATGQISFTAGDTGLYYLAYKVTEYRDGLPLGEIMAARLAYVLPNAGNTVEPQCSDLKNIVTSPGATWDGSRQLFEVCEGSSLSFDLDFTSDQPDANILVTHDYAAVLQGAAVTLSGTNTDSARLHVAWTAPSGSAKGNSGAHGAMYYPYANWTDTACGHYPAINESRGIRVRVRQCQATGVEESSGQQGNALSIFPNPASSSSVTVRSDAYLVSDRVSIRLTDALGRDRGVVGRATGGDMRRGVRIALPEEISSGVYVLSTTTGQAGSEQRGKVMILR